MSYSMIAILKFSFSLISFFCRPYEDIAGVNGEGRLHF